MLFLIYSFTAILSERDASTELVKIPLFKSPGCFARVAVDFTIENVRQNWTNNHPNIVSNNYK